MAKQYEPFLINPPRGLPSRFGTRRSRIGMNPRRFRRNAFDTSDEHAFDLEWKELAQHKHRVAGAKKAAATKKKKAKLGGKMAKKTVKAKAKAKARAGKPKLTAMNKASLVRLVKALGATKAPKRGKKKVAEKRLVERVVKRGKKKSAVAKRIHAHVKHAKATVKAGKRKYSRKELKGRKRRHIAVARYGKAWRTVPGVHKPFRAGVKVNPFRRNPFGSALMVVGANPRRKKSRKSGGSMAKRKRFTSNPMSSIKALLPMIAAGTAGAVATKMAPKLLGMTNVWAGYGTQAAVIVAGGWAADKYINKNVSDAWIIGGAAMVLSSVISTTLGGVFAGLGLDYEPELQAFPDMQAFPEGNGMGMLGNEGEGNDYDLEGGY